MKTFALISGLAWLQQAAAACCRSNQCFKAIVEAGAQGTEECSANLVVTVTPDAVTFTETASIATEYQTVVDVETVTVTETTTAATETDVLVVSQTVTALTETQLQLITQTVVATQANTQFVTVTPTTIVPWRRALISSVSSSPVALPTFPSQCPSWEEYLAACKCASVTPVTVTAEAAVTTVTVGADSTVTASVLSAVISTQTVHETATATVLATTTETISVIATALETQTVVLEQTVTAQITQTQTASAEASLITHDVPGFRALATDYNNSPLYMYANMLNALSGGLNWQAGSTSTSTSVQNKYAFKIDSQGRVLLANGIPPYTYTYALYVSTASTGSFWPQINTLDAVQNSVNNGGAVSFVYGAVDPATNRLYLKAGGRNNILWCGGQLWLSAGMGEDINRGGACVPMHPTLAALV